jgi:hypothetical protein
MANPQGLTAATMPAANAMPKGRAAANPESRSAKKSWIPLTRIAAWGRYHRYPYPPHAILYLFGKGRARRGPLHDF